MKYKTITWISSSLGVEAELINSPDSLGEEIAEYCQEGERREEERRRTLTAEDEESVEVIHFTVWIKLNKLN